MKSLFLLTTLVALQAATAHAATDSEFTISGYELDCLDDDGNPADRLRQGRLAIRDMLKSAEAYCGENRMPIQTGETVVESAHACFQYRLGAVASAKFKCGTSILD